MTPPQPPLPLQSILRPAAGVLVGFVAFGFAAWLSGAAAWVAFYAGARGGVLAGVAQAAVVVGFLTAAIGGAAWYACRCRRGEPGVPPRLALAACLALPLGGICWAVFVDATAWHYGQDVVRPAFDNAVLYPVLVGLPVLAVGVPLLAWASSRAPASRPSTAPARG